MKLNNQKLRNDLDAIMEKGLNRVHMPYAKGKSVRIRNTVIRETKQGFLVFDVKTHKRIGEFFSKRGAIAYAKAREKSNNVACIDIANLDNMLCKHYMDSLFFKNTIEKTTDSVRREATEIRFEISKDKTYDLIAQIDRNIFD